jgi:hypothetical protein
MGRVTDSKVATLIGVNSFVTLEALPGADLVGRGAADLDAGRESPEALLVSIGAPRLRSLGIELSTPIASPEHRLYALLVSQKGDAAHSAYNALIRRLVSFERAAACAS